MKGDDIADRLLDFSMACLRVAVVLKSSPANAQLSEQILRGSTLSGVSYWCAERAQSRAEFVERNANAAKQVRATVYRLRVIQAAGLGGATELGRCIEEGGQLQRMLVDRRYARDGWSEGSARSGPRLRSTVRT